MQTDMKLYTYKTGVLKVNTYILVNEETGDAIAIDVGGDGGYLIMEGIKKGFRINTVLLTHGHFDHIGGVKYLQNTGAKVYIGEKDSEKTLDNNLNAGRYFGIEVDNFKVDGTLTEGRYTFSGMDIKVIETPGHTEGGLTFVVENMIFSGDTLFCGSYGRTDLGDGDILKLKSSIEKLFDLEGEYIVYPGHDESTTLSYERLNNPILEL